MTCHPQPNPDRPRPEETTSLVLRAVSTWSEGQPCAGFLARRLEVDAGRLENGSERAAVDHLARLLAESPDGASVARVLVNLSGALERDGRLDEAAACLDAAERVEPGDAETALHAARIARKGGAAERAAVLYEVVRERCGASDPLCRMAEVGQAMLADDPARGLGKVLRRSVRDGDSEAAAVAQEERGRRRRSAGDRLGALRDYLCAAARFRVPVDRGRLLHEAADMLSARGDLMAARELLLVALDVGRTEQRLLAANRLHTLSRTLGDEVGRRRWATAGPAPLVSLTPSRRAIASESAAPLVARWIRRVPALDGAGSACSASHDDAPAFGSLPGH